MTDSVPSRNPFGCMRATMLVIARAVLFISCLLLALGQILSFYILTLVDKEAETMAIPRAHCSGYLAIITLFIISLIGLYASYTKDISYLRLFSALILTFSMAQLGVALYRQGTTDWAGLSHKFDKMLADMQPNYQWYAAETDQIAEATRMWDTVQSRFMCCGLKKPNDWASYRPPRYEKDIMPKSCCPLLPRAAAANMQELFGEAHKCHLADAYPDPCKDRFEDIIKIAIYGPIYSSVLFMVLSFAACALAKHEEFIRFMLQPEYIRFGGSIYARQPVAPQHQHHQQQQQQPQQQQYVQPEAQALPPKYTLS